jgi:ribosomal-protein-alanine N-acetyltransferase
MINAPPTRIATLREMLLNPTITIQTPRITLREYQRADFPGVHAYSKDPEAVRFMTWGPNTPQETRDFIQGVLELQHTQPRHDYFFVVISNQDKDIIGGCGLHLENPKQRGGTLGYIFNRAFWGQGYASETAQALIQLGFSHLGLHRIIATCDTRNLASARVMEKNHMRREAHFLQHMWQKGEWRDSYLYAILAEEWHAGSDTIAILYK